ncbi:DUF1501 domain-containing protein [Frigoriglobus tundricola]|uniref:DUF1501 domain-containing protein n=1 Tax=Frigoriglobus tundricola TaxID=2774151 RepID=UPI00148EE786|nr:DUF1501 domain-containing protein [Frigoriglobus tundricola]
MRTRLCDGVDRRDVLRIGALGAAGGATGLSLDNVLRAQEARPAAGDPTFGRARSCILVFLAGGPPQHETFDPKPDAPREIAGAFEPIATSVPGVHISGYLPLHDHPCIGAAVAHLRPSGRPIPAHVCLGEFPRAPFGWGGRGAGAGFLGAPFDPFPLLRSGGETRALDYPVAAPAVTTDVSLERLGQRRDILDRINRRLDRLGTSEAGARLDAIFHRLGSSPETELNDRFGRPSRLCQGKPIHFV